MVLSGGHIAALAPPGSAPDPLDELSVDLEGFLLLPALAEPHAHVDKARSWDLANPPACDLEGAIEAWRSFASSQDRHAIYCRARQEVLALVANGATAIRSHVDLFDGPDPLRGVEALAALRAELADLVDIQLVALGRPGASRQVVDGALAAGVDLVGGAPHLAPEPLVEMDRLFDVAEAAGVGLDLHTDERLDGPLTAAALARRARRYGKPVTASHCCRLGTLDENQLMTVVGELADAGVGVVSLPATNLYLQGRGHQRPTPRGLTALRPLLDAGVTVAAGGDNVRDPFNPMGRSDPLETASLLVTAGQLRPEEAAGAVGDQARLLLGLPAVRIEPGAPAELLAIRVASLTEAVAVAPPDRRVIHRGRLVACSDLRRQTWSDELSSDSGGLT